MYGRAYGQLDFFDLIEGNKNDEEWNEVLKFCVLSRLLKPTSKFKSAEEIKLNFDKKVPVQKIYRMMDRLANNEEKIKRKVFQRSANLLDNSVDVAFFDVTTLYFESFTPDGLREFGFSKDCKFKETQIVLALVTSNRGVPLTYEIFPGNFHEGKTLIKVIESLRTQGLNIKNICLVADRAMFNEENLKTLEKENIGYIVAAKLKTLKKSLKEEIITHPTPGDWTKEISLGNRKLVVSHSQKRAEKDVKDRNRLIERLMKKVSKGTIAVSKLISNYGTKKYVSVDKTEAKVNFKKIQDDARWDGIHGVITNLSINGAEILQRYRGLWKIEEVFRINKTDLKMRPIYHWVPRRIRAHILICFISYSVSQHVIHQLQKKNVHLSFARLNEELSRIEISYLRDKKSQKEFTLPSSLTELQKSIYEVLEIPIQEKVLLQV